MDNVEEMNDEKPQGYQVVVVNCKWSNNTARTNSKRGKHEELPDNITLDIPENVVAQASKKNSVFNDVIETFTYNVMSRKFGYELNHCQIYLPLA